MEENTRKLSSILAEAMQAKNISFEKLAALSNVSERFLEPLLQDDYAHLPASPYLRGYILKISQVLGLEGEKIWETYFKESPVVRKSGGTDELPKNRFEKAKIDRRYIAGAILGLVFIVYVGWKIQSYFSVPNLELQDFTENMVTEKSPYELSGVIDPKNQLFINGEQIYPDETGKFEKTVELQPGFNALSFKIKKFLGSEYIIEKQIYFKTATSSRSIRTPLETGENSGENIPTTTEAEASAE